VAATIREYTDADLEGCRELWRHLTQRHRDIYEDPTIGGADPGPYFDEHYLPDEKPAKLWVAERDGQLVGLCGLLVQGDEAVLEPIVVRPGDRNHGVGSQLAQQAITEAERLGVKYINVRPVGRNVEAIRFFHREGFDVLGRVELSKRLAAEPFPKHRTVEVHGRKFTF
jgi:N-acetylglutamate synthase-like GNAT family acetyltransferase